MEVDWSTIKWFKKEEFACRCCGVELMDHFFVKILDGIRYELQTPMVILSGYRCEKHDKEVGGKGNHTKGLAADIKCEDAKTRYLLIKYFSDRFARIGIGKAFIHIDCVEDKDPYVCWIY